MVNRTGPIDSKVPIHSGNRCFRLPKVATCLIGGFFLGVTPLPLLEYGLYLCSASDEVPSFLGD